MSAFTDQELKDYFDSLPEDKRDGMTVQTFMNQVKAILDPKKNAKILDDMVAIRRRHSIARQQKAVIDRAQRNAAVGLR